MSSAQTAKNESAKPTPKQANWKKRILVVLAILVVLYCAGTLIVTRIALNVVFGRQDPDEGTNLAYTYEDLEAELPRENFSFPSGDVTLQGYVYGVENTKGVIVFSHGYGPGHSAYSGIIQQMVERGWRVIAYDMTGCATSDGDAYHGLTQAVYDLNACLDYVESTYLPEHKELSNKPLVLMGHSNGAYATAVDLRRNDPCISGAIVISGFNKPMEVTMEWGRAIAGDWVDIAYPAAWINTHLQYGADEDLTAVDGINGTQVPVLIMHGARDTSVGYNTTSIISRRSEITNPNATFVTITTENSDSHSGIFNSSAAGAYKLELQEEAQKLAGAAGMSVEDYGSTPEAQAWAATWDKQLANEPNPDFYGPIDEFLSQFAA